MPQVNHDESSRFAIAAALIERYKSFLCTILLILVALLSLGHAFTRSLFYDEIATVHAAALPTWRDVWNFYAKGLDTPSPLSSLVVRPMLHLHGSVELTARLPFLAAFLVFLYCIYRLILHHYPAGFALSALLVPVYFDELFFYSYEARVYAFMLAGTAFALLCWQAADDRRPKPLMALGVWTGLALAIFCHAFAILLFLPFAAGEWLRSRERKTVDWSMWAALVLFPLGFLPTLPGERQASAFYRAQFFAKPSLKLIPGLFRMYLGSQWVVITLIFCAGLALPAYRCWSASRKAAARNFHGGIAMPEALLLLLLAAMPVYGMVAGLMLHAFREPYILSFYLGFIVLAIALTAEASCRSERMGALLLGLMCLGLLTNQYYVRVALRNFLHPQDTHRAFMYAIQQDPLIQVAKGSQLPIAFGDHVLYSSFFEYGDAPLRARMVYPVDLADSAPYPKGITSQLNFKLFGSLFGWHAPEWQTFSQQHSHFLLLRGTDPNVWFFPYLTNRMRTKGDVTMRLLASSPLGEVELYDVQLTR